MDDRLTIEKLIAALAVKLKMEQADAEAFVCSFFTLIEDGLKKDKYVRIKGFGTFKLIDDNGNTGKIVFVPELMVRDAINKPFAHFQPVELHDGVCFNDLDEQTLSSDEMSDVVNESLPGTEEGCLIGNSIKDSDIVHCDENEKGHKGHNVIVFKYWYLMAIVLFVGIVIGCGIMWWMFSGKDDLVDGNVKIGYSNDDNIKLAVDTVTIGETDSITDNSKLFVNNDTTDVNKKTIDSIITTTTDNKTEVTYLKDDITYKISGELGSYTITKGSTLSKIAHRYYKNRKLWPYIVMYNKDVIEDPNNVPIGTILRIPKLTPLD